MKFKCFVLLILLISCGCKETIIHSLSEKEANQLLTKLHAGSLHPQKIREPDGTWAISVDRGETMLALKYLDDSRMLRSKRGIGSKGASMISSREEQQFQYERAQAREIEDTLASVEGVLEARVHLNIERADPLLGRSQEAAKRSSASVLLVTSTGYDIERSEIASLIAGAAGVDPKNVMVLIDPSQSAGSQDDQSGQKSSLDISNRVSLLEVFEGEQLIMLLGGVLFVVGIVLLGHSLFPRMKFRRSVGSVDVGEVVA